MKASGRIERFMEMYADGELMIAVGSATPSGVAWLAQRTANRRVLLLIADTRSRHWQDITEEERKTCADFIVRHDVEIRNWYRGESDADNTSSRIKVWAIKDHRATSRTAVLVGSGNLDQEDLEGDAAVMVEAYGTDRTETYRTGLLLWEKAEDCEDELRNYLNIEPLEEDDDFTTAECGPWAKQPASPEADALPDNDMSEEHPVLNPSKVVQDVGEVAVEMLDALSDASQRSLRWLRGRIEPKRSDSD